MILIVSYRMHKSIIHVLLVTMIAVNFVAAAPLAYWRFDQGPAGTPVLKPFGALDSSGNGYDLDPWSQGGWAGFVYRSAVAMPTIPLTGAANNFSIKNDGDLPGMATDSADAIRWVTPAAFTIEAFFKPEAGGHRTLVGRDSQGATTSNAALSALYFKINPADSVEIVFGDVSGYWHVAASADGLIQGFTFDGDPDGLLGNWYYMAAVSDGSVLSLYVANITAGTGLQLVAQTDMTLSGSPNTALTAGAGDGADWDAGNWSVGRGLYNGKHTDRAYGYIDEVRISNTALETTQFLIPVATVERNPVMDGADPDVLLVGNTLWMYPTYGPRGQLFTFSSKDLVHWQTHGPILNFANIPWIPSGKYAWAPGVTEKNGKYYVYYSVGPKPSHIGVASSSSPSGPFVDKGGPLLSDNNDPTFEAIDARVFTDPISGTSYLYAGGSAGSRLRVFELNSNMTSFAREIAVSNPTNFTEGVFMHCRNGVYYLSYSHGGWNNDTYSVHYSTASSPVGPWTYQGALMVSSAVHKGPGHHSFLFNAAMGQWYIVYHRWNNRTGSGPYSGSRSIAIEQMHYESDGRIKPFVLTDTGVGPVWLGNTLPADFDENGVVNGLDALYLAGQWLTHDAKADIMPIGGDGLVDFSDFGLFARQWRQMSKTE